MNKTDSCLYYYQNKLNNYSGKEGMTIEDSIGDGISTYSYKKDWFYYINLQFSLKYDFLSYHKLYKQSD